MLYVATRFRACSLCVNRKYRPILCVSIYTYNCMVSKDDVSEEHDILLITTIIVHVCKMVVSWSHQNPRQM